MEYFLSEISNTIQSKDLPRSFIQKYIKNGQLEYGLLLKSPEIINIISYVLLFKEIYGIYPSKLDIPPPENENNFNFHMNFLLKNTVIGLFGKSFLIKQDIEDKYTKNKYRLENDIAFVKQELFSMLSDRVNQSRFEYDSSITLWKGYQNMFQEPIQDWYNKQQHEVIECCPFTKHIPDDLKIPSKHMLTINDIIKHIVCKNYFFLIQLYNKRCIISEENVDIKDIVTTFPSYVLNQSQNKKYLHCIPKICSECIIISEDTSLPSLSEKVLHINDFNGPNEALCFYVNTRIKEFLNIPRSINIPSTIQNEIFKLNKNVSQRFELNNKSNATVLIIDNRANIMSVIAANITLSNLIRGKWSVTIITSPKCYDFYKKHFPTSILLSHPLQEKSPFDIEDYNIMLKSKSFWELLDKQNINTALLIQDDGFIIRQGMEQVFMDLQTNKCLFDYVGAPWPENDVLKKAGTTNMIGNGGLSLRDVQAMLEITQKSKISRKLFNNNIQPIPEDVFFSVETRKSATKEFASMFSSEMILNPKSFGIHKPWGYFPLQDIIKSFFS